MYEISGLWYILGMERFELTNSEGKVEDPVIAEEMAYIEKPFRENKKFGIFKPGKKKILEGENSAITHGKQLIKEKNKRASEEQAISQVMDVLEENVPEIYRQIGEYKTIEEKIEFLKKARIELTQKGKIWTSKWVGKEDRAIEKSLAILLEEIGEYVEAQDHWLYAGEKEKNEKFKITIQEKIETLHNKYNPQVIFLTMSSSILFGWVIREAWKVAWPNEDVPIFFTIDPHPLSAEIDGRGADSLIVGNYDVKTPDEYRKYLVEDIEEKLKIAGNVESVVVIDEGACDGLTLEISNKILLEAIRNSGFNSKGYIFDLGLSRWTGGPFRRRERSSGKKLEETSQKYRNGMYQLTSEQKKESKIEIERAKKIGIEVGKNIFNKNSN